MREKLYSLIHNFLFDAPEVSDMNLAEYLIANGVTIPVRCKDCVSYEERCPSFGYCYHWDYEQGMSPNQVDGDDFCSYGERKDND